MAQAVRKAFAADADSYDRARRKLVPCFDDFYRTALELLPVCGELLILGKLVIRHTHGYGPRLPLLVISPYARRNSVDHTITDLTSTTRFIEDNWSLGGIGGGSFDAIAGPLTNLFDFTGHHRTRPLFLKPDTGELSH
jgi:hypothetical protein